MRKFQYQTNPVIHQSTSRPPLKKFANRERTQSDSCMALYTVTWKPRAHVLPLTMLASITYILLREILDYIRLRIEVNIWARIPFPRSGQGSTNYSLSRFRPKGIRRARSPAQTYTFYVFFSASQLCNSLGASALGLWCEYGAQINNLYRFTNRVVYESALELVIGTEPNRFLIRVQNSNQDLPVVQLRL